MSLADIPVVVARDAEPAKARSVPPPARSSRGTLSGLQAAAIYPRGTRQGHDPLWKPALARGARHARCVREPRLPHADTADGDARGPARRARGRRHRSMLSHQLHHRQSRQYLRSEAKRIGPEEVSKNFIYVTAGSCGACRFGQYHQSYELALRNSGLYGFRMFLIGQEGLDQGAAAGGGLDLNLPFLLGSAWSVLLADVVQDLEYQTRPYEIEAGRNGARLEGRRRNPAPGHARAARARQEVELARLAPRLALLRQCDERGAAALRRGRGRPPAHEAAR